jgi:ATP-dependent helicase/nuclease subunit A
MVQRDRRGAMKPLRIHDRTTEQRAAADPGQSVWVAANAGAGKTAVLTDRVARLLLAGTRPEAILCITFTKAAAAEMSNRLYEVLAQWSAASDDELRRALLALLGSGEDIDAKLLTRARALFAKVLDTPGGLRFQTIHSFCESLLKRFPLEAGVPPNFAVADDRRQAELHAQAEADLLDDTGLTDALDVVVGATQPDSFRALLRSVIDDRAEFARALANGADAALTALQARIGTAPGETEATAFAVFERAAQALPLRAVAEALDGGKATDRKYAALLFDWLAAPDRLAADEQTLAKLLYDSKGEPRRKFATKDIAAAHPQVETVLADLGDLYAGFIERRKSIALARRSAALLRLADRLLALYARAKARAAVLDFDDLIARAAELLSTRDVAPWVLWKLDGGIDHVLVDEAQDTNPDQWRVIGALAEEFFAGAGAKTIARTLFAVGDEKQSIFSFQGARPDKFAEMQAHFSRAVRAAERRWSDLAIGLSFRSTPDVLRAVDHVFAPASPARAGVAAVQASIRHLPHRAAEPGLVELWALTEGDAVEDSEGWDVPLDQLSAASAQAKLAQRIALQIKAWLNEGARLAPGGPAIRAGDVMILVRRRNALFHAIVRALKVNGVPVAGADRMLLMEQLAVQDLVALGQFALLPDDDLTLAAVLKGPLFGFIDDDLFALCHGREKQRLWPLLRARAGEQPHWAAALQGLRDILGMADLAAPYEFYANLLGARGGRRKLLVRLGPDAIDPIDEFLALALAYQRDHAASLQGFLQWLRETDVEVKRDLEQKRDEVRVMTVHASKGLEAPIVFLPDTVGTIGANNDPAILWDESSDTPLPLWPGSAGNDTALTDALRIDARAAQHDEFRRLLYVALTRARDRLYVCGTLPARSNMLAGSWYELVGEPLRAHPDIRAIELPEGGTVWRLGNDPPPPVPAKPEAVAPTPLPAWIARSAPPEPQPTKPLTPSRLAPEPAPRSPLGPDNGWGFKRGRLVHRLLQLLPELAPEARRAAAQHFLARPLHGLSESQQEALAAEVLAVLDHPYLAAVFSPGSRAEMPLAGRVGEIVISGQIDRVAVSDGEVLIVDYKTNRPPPRDLAGVDPSYLRQLALYAAALRDIFPGRPIRAALLWTDGPFLMELPDVALQSALPWALP